MLDGIIGLSFHVGDRGEDSFGSTRLCLITRRERDDGGMDGDAEKKLRHGHNAVFVVAVLDLGEDDCATAADNDDNCDDRPAIESAQSKFICPSIGRPRGRRCRHTLNNQTRWPEGLQHAWAWTANLGLEDTGTTNKVVKSEGLRAIFYFDYPRYMSFSAAKISSEIQVQSPIERCALAPFPWRKLRSADTAQHNDRTLSINIEGRLFSRLTKRTSEFTTSVRSLDEAADDGQQQC